MTAVNDSQKKVTVHEPDVVVVNGMDVYLDKEGKVIRSEKHVSKRKSFKAATDKLNDRMPDEKEMALAQMMALREHQND